MVSTALKGKITYVAQRGAVTMDLNQKEFIYAFQSTTSYPSKVRDTSEERAKALYPMVPIALKIMNRV